MTLGNPRVLACRSRTATTRLPGFEFPTSIAGSTVPIFLMLMPFGASLFLLASAFFGWLAAADAYPVLDLLTAGLARTASTGLAHINLLDSR
jgi:hypothetical protein